MTRRDALRWLAAAWGLAACHAVTKDSELYAPALASRADATLLHLTDCHAQLLPGYLREPEPLTFAEASGLPRSARAFLAHYALPARSAAAHAFTADAFTAAARHFGPMGGFAHLATLVEQLRAQRGAERTLLVDGGDSWQGSAMALWTHGEDMVAVANRLGIALMTGHWEFTYGMAQVQNNLRKFDGQLLAHNIHWREEAAFDEEQAHGETDQVFAPYQLRQLGNVTVALIGLAFPYQAVAHPAHWTAAWRFTLDEAALRHTVAQIRHRREAEVIVLLSHAGLAVDLKLAARVPGIDFILGGHTHDALPQPIAVRQAHGITWVTQAGSHGKFLGVLDLFVRRRRLYDFRYRLLPVFAAMLPADSAMANLIETLRAPYAKQLATPLARIHRLAYRRDRFGGPIDDLLLQALRAHYDTPIALSPGFRWGPTLLPGEALTREALLNYTAITYPESYRRELSGAELKHLLEDVADNLFHPDPYYRQGGDMVRVSGLTFTCQPQAPFGQRITALRLADGTPLDAKHIYPVAGWAAVNATATGPAIWELVEHYLQANRARDGFVI